MSDILVGPGGQGSIGSDVFDPAPPLIIPVAIPGEIDFQLAGGLTTGQALSVGGAGNAAQGGRVRLARAAASVVAITARRTTPAMSSFTELNASFDRQYTDPANDVGSGALRMLGDDADLAAFNWDGNDLVQFLLNGDVDFTIVVEAPEKIAIDPEEEREQGWLIRGRGHLSLIERAVVYPVLGVGVKPAQEDRVWNWTNLDYDDSSWAPAHIVTYVLWVTPAPYGAGGDWGGFGGGWDGAFGDPAAAILWSTAGTILDAPVGKVYSRQWIRSVPSTRKRLLQVEADNACDVYFNEKLVLSTTGWTQMQQVEVDVMAGDNLLTIVCENWTPTGPYNPAGSAWTLLDYGYPFEVLARSDASAKILAYPASVPGMAIGKVIRLCVEEAQARGALLWLDLAFSDTHDSDGVPWPTSTEISTKVGTDYLTFFATELAETYIDLWMPPGSTTLYAWNKGGRGSSSGLTVHGTPDNTFGEVRAVWYSDEYNAWDYTIEGTNNRVAWWPLTTVTGNTSDDVADAFDPVSYRFVRIVVTNYRDGGTPDAALALKEFTVGGVTPESASSPDASFGTNTPDNAIDGDTGTVWQPTSSPRPDQGDWVGRYGQDGYVLAAWDGIDPAFVDRDAFAAHGIAYTLGVAQLFRWDPDSDGDERTLQDPDGVNREAATWYHAVGFTVTLTFDDAYRGNLHVYCLDYDGAARRQTVSVDDGSGAQVWTLGNPFDDGEWLTFPIDVDAAGTVTITATRTAGVNAVIAGLFLGDSTPPYEDDSFMRTIEFDRGAPPTGNLDALVHTLAL